MDYSGVAFRPGKSSEFGSDGVKYIFIILSKIFNKCHEGCHYPYTINHIILWKLPFFPPKQLHLQFLIYSEKKSFFDYTYICYI